MYRLVSGKVICSLGLCLALDVSVTPLFRFDFFYPPVFLYLLVLYTAFVWQGRHTFEMGVGVGLLKDLVSFQPLGLETIVLGLASFVLAFVVQKIDRESLVNRFLACFVFVLSVSFLVWGLARFLVSSSEISWYPVTACLTLALSTSIVMPVFFYLISWWFKDHEPLKQYELFG